VTDYPDGSVGLGEEVGSDWPDTVKYVDRVLTAANEDIDVFEGDDYANEFIESMTQRIGRRQGNLHVSPAQLEFLKQLEGRLNEAGRAADLDKGLDV